MTCCLTATLTEPECWLISSEVLWHSLQGKFSGNAQYIYFSYDFENYYIDITIVSPSGQGVWIGCRNLHHVGDHCRWPKMSRLGKLWWLMYSGMVKVIKQRSTNVCHYYDVILGAIESQITSLAIVYSTVYSSANQRKHQSSASLAFVRGIHRRPVNSPLKWPVTRKMFPFDDVIMHNTF